MEVLRGWMGMEVKLDGNNYGTKTKSAGGRGWVKFPSPCGLANLCQRKFQITIFTLSRYGAIYYTIFEWLFYVSKFCTKWGNSAWNLVTWFSGKSLFFGTRMSTGWKGLISKHQALLYVSTTPDLSCLVLFYWFWHFHYDTLAPVISFCRLPVCHSFDDQHFIYERAPNALCSYLSAAPRHRLMAFRLHFLLPRVTRMWYNTSKTATDTGFTGALRDAEKGLRKVSGFFSRFPFFPFPFSPHLGMLVGISYRHATGESGSTTIKLSRSGTLGCSGKI